MEQIEESFCYYSVLGLHKQATGSGIRDAYRKLALRWHPDRWYKSPKLTGEAKKRFQKIQEAYSVLSDKKKIMIYDAGLLGLFDDDDDQGFCDFMQEMAFLMQKEKNQEHKLEDLQGQLSDMMAENDISNNYNPSASKNE